jgi:hypothetical protein
MSNQTNVYLVNAQTLYKRAVYTSLGPPLRRPYCV